MIVRSRRISLPIARVRGSIGIRSGRIIVRSRRHRTGREVPEEGLGNEVTQ